MIAFGFLIAMVILFLHACTWEGMVLDVVRYRLEHLPLWVKKPLFDCPVCMAPWWGSLIIIAFGLVTSYYPHPFVWLIQLLIAGGINAAIVLLQGGKQKCNCERRKRLNLSDDDQ